MILNASNARKFYDEMGHENFDKVVRMAELIVHNTYFDEYKMPFKYISDSESMKYVESFFKSLNSDYYHIVHSILSENLKGFQSDSIIDYSKSETLPINDDLGFIIREVKENEFGESAGNFDSVTGKITINRENNIKVALVSVHELAHKLASSNNVPDVERYFYGETPSFTLEKLFLDWLEKTGYPHDEISCLRKERNNSSYKYAFLILITNELIKAKEDKVDLDKILNSLSLKIPNIDYKGLNMDALSKMYADDIDYLEYINSLLHNIPYVIGRVMSDYFVMDYRENAFNANIFKFINLFRDVHLDGATTRYRYMLLNLPFESDNMEELEHYFDGDIIDVEYEEVFEDKSNK